MRLSIAHPAVENVSAACITGVFSTRLPDRPNRIGISGVQVTGLNGNRIRVGALKAIHGTPILDVKPDLD